MPAARTPPDIDTLPALPRGLMATAARETAAAAVSRDPTDRGRRRKAGFTFATRETALRYLATWAWTYADELLAEIEQRRSTGYR